VSLDVPILFRWRQKRGEITMFTEALDKVAASRKATRPHHLLALFIALLFALTIYPTKVNAQIIGDLQANIPFQFHVGNTKFPAGEYRIHVFDSSDLTTMEIISSDGSASALFQVQEADTNSELSKSELIFNKYGNRYFLAKMFNEGNPNGAQVSESGYEKRISQQTAMEGQAHVSARHGKRQGK
jgi:hypothetical protein